MRAREKQGMERRGDEAGRALSRCWKDGFLLPSLPDILAFLPSSQQLILPGEPRSSAWYPILRLQAHPLPTLEALAWLPVQDSYEKLQGPSSLPPIPHEVTLGRAGVGVSQSFIIRTSRIRKSCWLADKLCDTGPTP